MSPKINLMGFFLVFWILWPIKQTISELTIAQSRLGTSSTSTSIWPKDITVIRASPTSVVVTWSIQSTGSRLSSSLTTFSDAKFQITYRPVGEKYSVIQETDGDKRAIILDNLRPGTKYRVYITALTSQGLSNQSDVVLFETDVPKDDTGQSFLVGTMSVRAEEIGIVVVVLALWVFVVVLFFNKWGKIRMLEPYQPQYKHPRTLSCAGHGHNGPNGLSQRLSLQLASFTSAERERLLYNMGGSNFNNNNRPRQNSVFVGNPYARLSLAQATPSRKVKSAEDINSMLCEASTSSNNGSRKREKEGTVRFLQCKFAGQGKADVKKKLTDDDALQLHEVTTIH
ncbi:hypothetical protein CHUAL_010252 [Chamberlinius hualienensis]